MDLIDESNLLSEVICPSVNEEDAAHLVQRLYGLKARNVKQLNSYDDKNFFVEVLSENENPHIQTISPIGYVLKILNATDSIHQDLVKAQTDLLDSLLIPGISVPKPVQNVNGSFLSLEALGPSNISSGKSKNSGSSVQDVPKFIVRLFKFVPGKLLKEVPYTKELLYEIGQLIAIFGNAVKGFSNPAITNRKYRWQMELLPELRRILSVIKDADQRILIEEILNTWTSVVEPAIPSLEKGLIHSDLNEQNVLVEHNNPSRICGLLDFGDVTRAPYVFDLAITITYILLEVNTMQPDDAVSHVVAGYITQRSITEQEWQILKECVAGRCAQSLVLGAYSHSVNPDNVYVLYTAKEGWIRLRRMWNIHKDQLIASWRAQIS